MKPLIISALLLLSCVIYAASDIVQVSTNVVEQSEETLWNQFLTLEEAGPNIRVSSNVIINRIITKTIFRAVNRMDKKSAFTQRSLQLLEIDTSRCDRMFLRNGKVIMVNIKEITYSDIIYSKCEAEDVTEYYVDKSHVYKVETILGETVYSGSTTPTGRIIERSREYGENLETEEFGSMAISMAGVGLILAIFVSMLVGVGLAIIALILAGISGSRLRKFPSRFKRNSSISIARVLAMITIVGTIILVALVSSQ
jgi:hypothetical protein